jgi:nucleotide-binding universal stress UspA family protein
VFVGADFTENSEAAMRFAGQLREIGPCEFTVGFVDKDARDRAGKKKHGPEEAPFNVELEEMLKYDLQTRAAKYLPGDRLQTRILPTMGQVENRLLDMAAESGADLIVIGTHQWHGLGRLQHRSVSRRILHGAQTSLALVPAHRSVSAGSPCISPARWILAPTDLTPHSGAAIPHAFSSLQPGGTVRLLHVTINEDDAPARRRQLQELIPAEAIQRGFRVETEVIVDVDPVKAICAAAERLNVDLVCMGSRAPSTSKALLGATTLGVLTHSKRPVLVVPQQTS